MVSNIVFIWYNKNNFVYNNFRYPFLHNFKYLSTIYNVYMVYYIEEDNINIPQNKNYFDFKIILSHYIKYIDNIKNMSNKIDLIKLIVLQNFNIFLECKDIILMDFDCNINNIKPVKYDIEPFFDRNCNYLKKSDVSNEINSYIENYATRINIKGSNWLKKNFNIKKIDFNNKNINNSYIYNIYINLICSYYFKNLKFNFLEILDEKNKLNFENTCNIKFSRGNSWNENNYINKKTQEHLYIYIYDEKIKPVYLYEYDKLKHYIYKENYDKIIKKIISLKKRNYNFNLNYDWCNNLQRYGTLLEFLNDRISNKYELLLIKKIFEN